MAASSSMMMDEDPPFESFSCPITGALMEDPVMTIGACASVPGDWLGQASVVDALRVPACPV